MEGDGSGSGNSDDQFVLWNLIRIGLGIALLGAFVWITNTFLIGPHDARIMNVERLDASTVELSVDACNQGEVTTTVESLSTTSYSVTVQTQDEPNGLECAAIVLLEIDQSSEPVTITDSTSGETFQLPNG